MSHLKQKSCIIRERACVQEEQGVAIAMEIYEKIKYINRTIGRGTLFGGANLAADAARDD